MNILPLLGIILTIRTIDPHEFQSSTLYRSHTRPSSIMIRYIPPTPTPTPDTASTIPLDSTPTSEISSFIPATLPTSIASVSHIPVNTTSPSTYKSTSSAANCTLTSSTSPPDELDEEQSKSTDILVILGVLIICIFFIHILTKLRLHLLPESIVSVIIGSMIGLCLALAQHFGSSSASSHMSFAPTFFFLLLLPPIIFESGYSMHKWNFFHNIGSILTFAVLGTILSAVIVGLGVWLLSKTGLILHLNIAQSLAFGSLISAVDPVATLAIFHAIDVSPLLKMLVFGESVLNDAVSIVLTKTVIEFARLGGGSNTALVLLQTVGYFFLLFFGSAGIGIIFGLASALIMKHFAFRRTPSFEFSVLIIAAYAPYVLAESLKLSGIMSILFGGITMSHYTHPNLSERTQTTMDVTLRTISFMAETCVFAYLGLAIFSFDHLFHPFFIIFSLILILLARAANIFPLSSLVNLFRQNKITRRMQFIMFYSGLRGAIAFALAINLREVALFKDDQDAARAIVTTTLVIVLFTILVFGGSTSLLLKCLLKAPDNTQNNQMSLSKNENWYTAGISKGLTEDFDKGKTTAMKGFVQLDYKYFMPFFQRNKYTPASQVLNNEDSRRLFTLNQGSSDEEIELGDPMKND